MTFPTEEQGREAQQQQEEQEQPQADEEAPADSAESSPVDPEYEAAIADQHPAFAELTGEQKIEALLSVHEAICGIMASQVENPAMAYRAVLAGVIGMLPRSDMPMVCNLIDSGTSSPEALVNAKAEVTRLIILGSMPTAEHKAPGRSRKSR